MNRPAADPSAAARARLRRASWIAGGMGLLALSAAAWVGLTASPKLTPPPLPTPNGFDEALKASLALQQAGFPPKDLDADKADAATLRPLVAANREAVAALRASARGPFQVPVTYELAALTEAINAQAPIRTSGARAAYAEARLAILEGRGADAAAISIDLVRLGDAMARDVPMMPYLASLGPVTLGLTGLRASRDGLDADALAAVIAELRALEGGIVPPSEPTRRELALIEQNVRSTMGMAGLIYRALGNLRRDMAGVSTSLALQGHRMIAARRLVLTDLALRLHRLRHGSDPGRLDDLVPAILDTVPIDPYTGRPLIYRRTASGHELYSAGPDGDDDRLNPTLGPRVLPTSDGDFAIDSF